MTAVEFTPAVASQTPSGRAAWLAKTIAACRSQIARVTEDARAQVAEINGWRDEQIGQLEREIVRLQVEIQPHADALIALDPLERRSVKLPGGITVGYRDVPAAVRIVDAKKATASVLAAGRDDLTRTPPAPEPVIDHDALSKACVVTDLGWVMVAHGEDGGLVPVGGVGYTPKTTAFYVR